MNLKKSMAVTTAAAFLSTGPGLPLASAFTAGRSLVQGHSSTAATRARVVGPARNLPTHTETRQQAPAHDGPVATLRETQVPIETGPRDITVTAEAVTADLANDERLQTLTADEREGVVDAERVVAMKGVYDLAGSQARTAVTAAPVDTIQDSEPLRAELGRAEDKGTPRPAAIADARPTAETAAPRAGVITRVKQAATLAAASVAGVALSAANAAAYTAYSGHDRDEDRGVIAEVGATFNPFIPYVAGAIASVGAVIIARSIFFQVPQEHVFVTNLLGKHHSIKTSGLSMKWPFVESIRRRISLQNQTKPLDFQAITSDQANVNLKGTLTYAVADAAESTIRKAAYTFVNDDHFMAALTSAVEGSIRSAVAELKQAEVLGMRDNVEATVRSHLDTKLAEWGYKIVNLQIAEMTFDKAITESMAKVVESKNDLRAAQTTAEALLISQTRDAEAEGDSLKMEAEAERQAAKAEGKGVADFRIRVANGLKTAIDQNGGDPTLVALAMTQETMRQVARDGEGKTLFVDPSVEGLKRMRAQLAELVKGSAQQAGDRAKDRSGSGVGDRSGIGGLWLLALAATLMLASSIGPMAFAYAGIGLAVYFALSPALFVVPEGYVVTTEIFGKFRSIKTVGLNVRIPILQTIKRTISVQNHTQNYEKVLGITKDQANVHFNTTLIYKVKDSKEQTIKDVTYKFIDDAAFSAQLKASIEGSIRSFVATKEQKDILGVREQIVAQVKEHLDQDLASWGYELVDLQINDIAFDAAITGSMAKVVAAENLKIAAKNDADAAYITRTKKAEAAAKATVIRANAKAEAADKRGLGIAEFQEEAAKGLKQAGDAVTEGMLSLALHLDMLREMARGRGARVIMMDGGSDSDVRRLMALQPGAAAAPAKPAAAPKKPGETGGE